MNKEELERFESFIKETWEIIEEVKACKEKYFGDASELFASITNPKHLAEKFADILYPKIYSIFNRMSKILEKRQDFKSAATHVKPLHISMMFDYIGGRRDNYKYIIDTFIKEVEKMSNEYMERFEQLDEFNKCVEEAREKLAEKFFEYTGKEKRYYYDDLYYPLDIYFKNVKNFLSKDYSDEELKKMDMLTLTNIIKQDFHISIDGVGLRKYYINFPADDNDGLKWTTIDKYRTFMLRLFEKNYVICTKDDIDMIINFGNMYTTEKSEARREMLSNMVKEYSKGRLDCKMNENVSYFVGVDLESPIKETGTEKLVEYFRKVA